MSRGRRGLAAFDDVDETINIQPEESKNEGDSLSNGNAGEEPQQHESESLHINQNFEHKNGDSEKDKELSQDQGQQAPPESETIQQLQESPESKNLNGNKREEDEEVKGEVEQFDKKDHEKDDDQKNKNSLSAKHENACIQAATIVSKFYQTVQNGPKDSNDIPTLSLQLGTAIKNVNSAYQNCQENFDQEEENQAQIDQIQNKFFREVLLIPEEDSINHPFVNSPQEPSINQEMPKNMGVATIKNIGQKSLKCVFFTSLVIVAVICSMLFYGSRFLYMSYDYFFIFNYNQHNTIDYWKGQYGVEITQKLFCIDANYDEIFKNNNPNILKYFKNPNASSGYCHDLGPSFNFLTFSEKMGSSDFTQNLKKIYKYQNLGEQTQKYMSKANIARKYDNFYEKYLKVKQKQIYPFIFEQNLNLTEIPEKEILPHLRQLNNASLFSLIIIVFLIYIPFIIYKRYKSAQAQLYSVLGEIPISQIESIQYHSDLFIDDIKSGHYDFRAQMQEEYAGQGVTTKHNIRKPINLLIVTLIVCALCLTIIIFGPLSFRKAKNEFTETLNIFSDFYKFQNVQGIMAGSINSIIAHTIYNSKEKLWPLGLNQTIVSKTIEDYQEAVKLNRYLNSRTLQSLFPRDVGEPGFGIMYETSDKITDRSLAKVLLNLSENFTDFVPFKVEDYEEKEFSLKFYNFASQVAFLMNFIHAHAYEHIDMKRLPSGDQFTHYGTILVTNSVLILIFFYILMSKGINQITQETIAFNIIYKSFPSKLQQKLNISQRFYYQQETH